MKSMLRMIPLAAALVAAAASVQAQAQAPANRSVVAVPQRPAPATFAAPTPGPSLPVAAGLRSPVPNPGGLTSQFPAGLPSPSPFPAGLPPLTTPNLASPNTVSAQTGAGTIVTPVGDGTVLMPASAIGGVTPPAQPVPPTQSMGGAAAPGASSAGAGPYTALQLSQAFQAADSNRDGDLTRAEALRLSIMTVGFDDMDRNKNGLVSRSEFEDSTR